MKKPYLWRGIAVCHVRAFTTVIVACLFTLLCCPSGSSYTIDSFIDNWAIEAVRVPSHPPDDRYHPSEAVASGLATVTSVSSRPVLPANRTKTLDHIILYLAGFAVLMIPFVRKRYVELKRLLDIIGSGLALSLLLPLILVIALLVKLDSTGPVLFKQMRVGMNRRRPMPRLPGKDERRGTENFGTPFYIYKFRTMRRDAESITGPVWARENDERITRIGRILRKTHLDEIPQFINVLKGEMCIIGPRPERPVFINRLNDCLPAYVRRLEIKPGITGLAQVRYHYAASVQDAKIKLRYDLVYMNKMCFMLDIGILLTTLNIVLSTKGAR